jgi:beta-propeller repeat-containing protein
VTVAERTDSTARRRSDCSRCKYIMRTSIGFAIVTDSSGNAYVTGSTSGSGFSTTARAFQTTFGGGFSDAFVAKFGTATGGTPTPVGSGVDLYFGTIAEVFFPSVTSAGFTTVTTSSTGPAQPVGFIFGTPPIYYDISTTAAYAGPVGVCISYNPLLYSDPTSFSLLHYEGGAWVDHTFYNSPNGGPGFGVICTQVSSLSPFIIATRTAVPPPSITITSPTSTTYETNQPVAASYTCTIEFRII